MFHQVNSYMFQTSMAHHHGVHSWIKQSFNLSIITSMWQNCWKFVDISTTYWRW